MDRSNFLHALLSSLSLKNRTTQNEVAERIYRNLQSRGIPSGKSLQQEILEEVAFSLRNNEQKLREAIEKCREYYHHIQNASSREEKEKWKSRYQEWRNIAMKEKWKFLVQREALGLIWTEELEKAYSLPPEI